MKLTKKDYISILHYYNIPIPKNKTQLTNLAEKILAQKLCRCIKKVSKKQKIRPPKEKGAIAICTKSIFKNRNLKRKKFTCKKKYKLLSPLSKIKETKVSF